MTELPVLDESEDEGAMQSNVKPQLITLEESIASLFDFLNKEVVLSNLDKATTLKVLQS